MPCFYSPGEIEEHHEAVSSSVVLDVVHRLLYLWKELTAFRKLDSFPSSCERREMPTLVGIDDGDSSV